MYCPTRSKARRLELGLTVEQLAERAGIGVRTLYRHEAGETVPNANVYVRLIEALRVPFAALLVEAEASDDPDEFPAVIGAVLRRRKDPHHTPMSTFEDAETALTVDGVRAKLRETNRG